MIRNPLDKGDLVQVPEEQLHGVKLPHLTTAEVTGLFEEASGYPFITARFSGSGGELTFYPFEVVSPKNPMIEEFRGPHSFLSNFCSSYFYYNGVEFPTVEHAYQYHKPKSYLEAKGILAQPTPGQAKRLGRLCVIRDNWDRDKDAIMEQLVRAKFDQNYVLKAQLLATNFAYLQEGNNWGDSYWGRVRGIPSQNKLGNILMKFRKEFQIEADIAPKEHRWSGWPGAWCLDCGIEDPREICAAEHPWPKCPNCGGKGKILTNLWDTPTKHEWSECTVCSGTGLVLCSKPECVAGPCLEHGSRRHDPYSSLPVKSQTP